MKKKSRKDIHDQKMIIVHCPDGAEHVCFNRGEAASVAAQQGRWLNAYSVFFSRIKRGFAHGGTRADLGFGIVVIKTTVPAAHRSRPEPPPTRKSYFDRGPAFPLGVTGTPPDRRMCGAGIPNNHGHGCL